MTFFRVYVGMSIIILAMLMLAAFNYASIEKNDTNKLPISLFSNNTNIISMMILNPMNLNRRIIDKIEGGKIEATPKTEYEKNQKFWRYFFIIYLSQYLVFFLIWLFIKKTNKSFWY